MGREEGLENWGEYRQHFAHNTGMRLGLWCCLRGGGGSALPEGEPDPCASVGRTIYNADSAQKSK